MEKATRKKAGRFQTKKIARQKIEESRDRIKGSTQTHRGIRKEIEREKIKLRNLEWITDRVRAEELPIYVIDFETDPFLRDRVPVPFVLGFYDGIQTKKFVGDSYQSCIEKFRVFLEDSGLEPGIIYAHNGGRFDFFYILDFFEGQTTIINSRIVVAQMPMGEGKHRFDKGVRFEFRDSYAIMPFPLAAYKKRKLPIKYLAKENRAKHWKKIMYYLDGDLIYLWELCMQFHREFGDYKTVASAAFSQLTSFHKYETLPLKQDDLIRSNFYYGGRVQCFQKGYIEKSLEIFDVNSMYPFVMDTFFHPTGWVQMEDNKIHGWNPDGTFNEEKLKTFFLVVEGRNKGAFATRQKDGSIDFEVQQGIFRTTIHEYLLAVRLGLFKTEKIYTCYSFTDYARFHLFVDHFYRARDKAKLEGDEVKRLFYKYILNSAYGKFGLNPENYFNWRITKDADPPAGKFWELDSIMQDRFYIWKQPSQQIWNVKNIAAAASITGAARSILLKAIAESKDVIYCDTDSIICNKFSGGDIDDKKLGAWKREGIGTHAAIAGKKMYAIFNKTECIKKANKGVEITPEEILLLAKGQEIMTYRDAPTFKRDGSAVFVSRKARMT